MKGLQKCIPFPSESQEWEHITNYNLIRNIIIHNNSVLDDISNLKNVATIKKFIDSNPHISINSHNEMKLDSAFSIEFLKTAENFLYKLYGKEE
jgi:hypothetical protein